MNESINNERCMFECGMFNCVLCSGLAVEQRKLVVVYFVGATQNDNHHYPPLNNDENKQQHSNILSELATFVCPRYS